MKRVLAILLLATLPLGGAHLKGFRALRAGPATGDTACALVLQDGETYNSTTEFITGRWLACRFTTTAGFTVCSVDLRLDDISGTVETLDLAIYSDSSDHPGTIVGSFSPTRPSSDVIDDAFYTFVPVATCAPTTTYWLVIRAGDTDVGVIVPFDNVGESLKDTMFSEDGLSWTDADANSVFNFRINGQ